MSGLISGLAPPAGEDPEPTALDAHPGDDAPASPDATVETTWPRAAVGSTGVPREDDFPLVRDDPYERGPEVARGGLGRILEGYDRRLGRRVALKVLIARDAKAEGRFIREAKITARLEHPNIVPIHEAGRWPSGERFYAMKLVEGRTLSEALAEADSAERRLALLPHVIDVADAVAYAHSQGILHRDLKPANVMVGPFGETLLIDWGLAKDLAAEEPTDPPTPTGGEGAPRRGSTETSDGIVVGTPPYMAPEQARADPIDERSDVYALGAMLYQVLCGHRPYEDVQPKDVLHAVVDGPPAPIERLAPELPRDLVAIVKKAMHRDPAERYPSAREMAEELRRFSTGQLVGAHRYSAVERARRFARRNAATLAVALALMGVLIAFAGWSLRGLAVRTQTAVAAQEEALLRVRELTLEKARSFLPRDPTQAVAWLKRVTPPLPGVASTAAEAQALGVAQAVLQGHVQEVELVRWGPRGDVLASGSRDGDVRVWSADGAALRRLDQGARVSALAFSPDGALLVVGAYDGALQIQDLATARPAARLRAHAGPVASVAFAPRGDRFVSVGRDGHLLLWTLDGRVAERLDVPPLGEASEVLFLDEGRFVLLAAGPRALVFDLDAGRARTLAEVDADVTAVAGAGEVIVLGARDGSVTLLDRTGDGRRGLEGHAREVLAAALTATGRRLATAGFDGRVHVWDLASEEPPRVFEDHDERVTRLAFSPDGAWLGSASWDGTLRLRHLESGELRTLRGHGQVVTDLAFRPDGRALASSSWDTTLRLWVLEPTQARVLAGHTVGVHAVDVSPDGALVASGGHDDLLRVWAVRSVDPPRVLRGHEDHVYRVQFSPDGRWLASSSDDRTVRLWSVDDGEARVFRGHRGDVEELVFSAEGNWLASAGRAGDLFLWSVPGGEPRPLVGHGRAVTGVGFVAGGRLASTGLDGQVYLWPLDAGVPLRLLSIEAPLQGLDVTPDGRRLAVVGGRGELWVWAMPEGRLVRRLEGLLEPDLVRLSRDGALVAVASAQRGLWICNLAYGLCDPLEGHEARVFALEFSPDGRAVVSASGDHTVRVWDAETLESRVVRGHRAPVFDVAVAPDGAWLASGSGDADVRLAPLRLPPRSEELGSVLGALTRHAIAN